MSITDGNNLTRNSNNKDLEGSKWSEEHEKTFYPPPVHYLPDTLTLDEVEYIIRLYRLDEL